MGYLFRVGGINVKQSKTIKTQIMKKVFLMLAAAAIFASCASETEQVKEEAQQVENQAENTAQQVENQAEQQADSLKNQAEQVEKAGEQKADQIEKAGEQKAEEIKNEAKK